MAIPSDTYELRLRRHEKWVWDNATKQRIRRDPPCPVNSWGHDADKLVATCVLRTKSWRTVLAEWLPPDDRKQSHRYGWNHGYGTNTGMMRDKAWFAVHKRLWPTRCGCGYRFKAEDEWSIDFNDIWIREDDWSVLGSRPHKFPPGAMYWAPWMDDHYKPQLEHCLCVILPDGTAWIIDSQATNCTMADDHRQERHHCWVLSGGPPPNVTAGKGGVTCSAGAGSIQSGGYHGFLQNGVLT